MAVFNRHYQERGRKKRWPSLSLSLSLCVSIRKWPRSGWHKHISGGPPGAPEFLEAPAGAPRNERLEITHLNEGKGGKGRKEEGKDSI